MSDTEITETDEEFEIIEGGYDHSIAICGKFGSGFGIEHLQRRWCVVDELWRIDTDAADRGLTVGKGHSDKFLTFEKIDRSLWLP